MKEVALGAYAHQGMPFEIMLVDELQVNPELKSHAGLSSGIRPAHREHNGSRSRQ